MPTRVNYRRGAPSDSRAVYEIFAASISDFGQRRGVMAVTGGDDPAVMAELWERRRPLFDHLAHTAEQFWLAEIDGQPVGYARTILRDGVRELTEFFVLPDRQSAGLGRELLRRSFSPDGARRKVIIATTDMRAQAHYLKLGVYPRFPIYYFSRPPVPRDVKSDLAFEPMKTSPDALARLADIDAAVLGLRRDEEHAWLQRERQGVMCVRNGRLVGYGYLGQTHGPFAALDAGDLPAILAHAESEAARNGLRFGVEVPMINRAAVDALLARGFQMDAFIALFMSDEPFGQFENYLFPSPPFFM